MPRDLAQEQPTVDVLLASPEPLRLWLMTKPPAAIVGRCHNSTGCLITTFLEENGAGIWAFDPYCYPGIPAGKLDRYDTDLAADERIVETRYAPAWAADIAKRFDGLGNGHHRAVTAAEALTLLPA